MLFLSYEAKLRKQAEKLYDALRERNIEVWMDTRDIVLGTDWRFASKDAFAKADAMIIIAEHPWGHDRIAELYSDLGRDFKDPGNPFPLVQVVKIGVSSETGPVRPILVYSDPDTTAGEIEKILKERSGKEHRGSEKPFSVKWRPANAGLFYEGSFRGTSPQKIPTNHSFEIFSWFHRYFKGRAGAESPTIELEPFVFGKNGERDTPDTYVFGESSALTARKVRILLEQKDISLAREWCRHLLHKAPQWFGSWHIRGMIELHDNRPHPADFYFSVAEHLAPSSAVVAYAKAISACWSDDPELVREKLMRILDDPGMVSDYVHSFPLTRPPYLCKDAYFERIRKVPGGEEMLAEVGLAFEKLPLDALDSPKAQAKPKSVPLCLRGFCIENFHDFAQSTLSVTDEPPWIFLTGDNAEGKTSLLQALAIGLFGVRGAVHLIGSDQPCRILVWLQSGATPLVGDYDHLNKKGDDSGRSVAGVLGYGPSRLDIVAGLTKAGSTEETANPVYGLLHQRGHLRDVEQWLKDESLRYLQDGDEKIEARIEAVCHFLAEAMPSIDNIFVKGKDVIFREKGRSLISRQLSAGNTTILALVGDMIVRLLASQPEIAAIEDLEGIVLIDELETHLHPRSQYELPYLLHQFLPRVQFIASTHSPLPLLGAPEGARVIHVGRNDEGNAQLSWMDEVEIDKLMPNSVLTSPIFGFNKLLARGGAPREVYPEDEFLQIIRNRTRDAALKKAAGQNYFPTEFFDPEDP